MFSYRQFLLFICDNTLIGGYICISDSLKCCALQGFSHWSTVLLLFMSKHGRGTLHSENNNSVRGVSDGQQYRSWVDLVIMKLCRYRNVVSSCWNMISDGTVLTDVGRLFHTGEAINKNLQQLKDATMTAGWSQFTAWGRAQCRHSILSQPLLCTCSNDLCGQNQEDDAFRSEHDVG